MNIPNEGAGEYHNDSSNPEEWSAFDQEWFELQNTYKAENNDDSEEDLQVDWIGAEIKNRLGDYELPRVIDSDPDNDLRLCLEFIDAYRDKRLDELQWSSERENQQNFVLASIEALKHYHDRREAEWAVIFCIVSYKLAYLNRDKKGFNDVYMRNLKSQFLAVFQVHYKLEPQWLQFYHDLTRTDEEEPSPYYEAMYDFHVDFAWESLSYFQSNNIRKWQVIDKAFALTGMDTAEDSPEDIITVMGALIDMQDTAALPIENESDRANRNELIWEFGRDANLDSETIKKVADFFDETYPVQG